MQFAEEEEDEAHEGSQDRKESQGDHIVHFPGFSRLLPVFQSGFFRSLAVNRAPKAVSVSLSFPPVSTRPTTSRLFAQGLSNNSLVLQVIFQLTEMTLGEFDDRVIDQRCNNKYFLL